MPYFLRLFSPCQGPLSFALLRSCIADDITLELEAGHTDDVESLLLRTPDGRNLGIFEKADAALLRAEVKEFIDDLMTAKRANAARWMSEYLARAKLLVSFQVLDAGFENTYGGMPGEILWSLKCQLGEGILQVDREGFTNDDGYQIVWQFSDDVSGFWKMAILDGQSDWIAFEMDLGNEEHRRAFQAGKVPSGVAVLAN